MKLAVFVVTLIASLSSLEEILAAPVYRGRHHPNGTGHRKPTTNQHRKPTTNQHRKPNTNQHRKPNTNQHRKPNKDQHRNGSTQKKPIDPRIAELTDGRFPSFAGATYAYTSPFDSSN
ncbi:hypothetical protein MJO28_013273 [Puccinia striiformis f. sp. tritici]|uniref:Secreted protein n=2 Tax=Puccinia striiformis f. sp. tritici TaxID=168172 RepID=A0A0L0UV66_9BASI|nr:uncharacterized protein Pst134EA_031569 [Puccinia striiformis f. sp. tritici]XP_047800600.1 hypothetical protein Pst134EA_024268 [Puccinia striiformis f. sp. tritici]KAI9619364.1 hypothetical protein KEM48_006276 [Puccinia striiformis f. sp. tritici PST-130]KNE90644.1 hypothetical protein PSTG_15907 [Puccinia striiformis f. sp. tritici PST-78]KAH9442752.1 hypothetical protein Pst134EA_031569 [Puccinia striiformis f. sp. tritici]KAH9444700.1 hypothetical protein Pst134EB_024956 [Puccinia str